MSQIGRLSRVAGPLAVATNMSGSRLHDVVRVGSAGLLGEIIRLDGEVATIQVHEDTTGLRAGEPVAATGGPLVAELGPGLLGGTFDGLQRSLPAILSAGDPYMKRGVATPALDRARRWAFHPEVEVGGKVSGGDVLGTLPEGGAILHRVLVPPGVAGDIVGIESATVGVDDVISRVRTVSGEVVDCTLVQRWPVRRPRPHGGALPSHVPLITGQRVIDTLFPLAKGGTAVVPGGFGTGKTVMEQALAKCADTDVVVYVGCGERGNEMAEVLADFPRLRDRRTGAPLMDRTVLIANTSNMPVAAREASVYTGITIAEYYRDMGYDVALLIDSTSRWAEALREVSSRLEEMPGEEGYPAYLSSRLASLYERGGRIRCLAGVAGPSGRTGSITIVGAVSPPGGDLSEPMTQSSLRVAGALWALDRDLAHRRHFPAVSWTRSYSLYLDQLSPWFDEHVDQGWSGYRRRAIALLQQEEELQAIVQLVGPDALPPDQRLALAVARMIEEDFLRQSSYHLEDAFSPLGKACQILRAILAFYDGALDAVRRGADPGALLDLPDVTAIARLKEAGTEEVTETVESLVRDLPDHLLAVG